MPVTTIADLQIVPSKLASYILERTTEKSMLVRSGVTSEDPTVNQLISGTPKGWQYYYHAILQTTVWR